MADEQVPLKGHKLALPLQAEHARGFVQAAIQHH
jgi:hypothetical protein